MSGDLGCQGMDPLHPTNDLKNLHQDRRKQSTSMSNNQLGEASMSWKIKYLIADSLTVK